MLNTFFCASSYLTTLLNPTWWLCSEIKMVCNLCDCDLHTPKRVYVNSTSLAVYDKFGKSHNFDTVFDNNIYIRIKGFANSFIESITI